jgi:hypothetical protein
MPTSQVRVRHVLVITADCRTNLAGHPLLYVHPTISMTLSHSLSELLTGPFMQQLYVTMVL